MTINFLNIFQVLIGIALVGFILIQRGPGATAGSAFGAGASGTVFGAKGSGSFLTKTTALLATAFFIVTLMIAIDSRTQYTAEDKPQDSQDLGVVGSAETEKTPQLTVPEATQEQTGETQPIVNEADATAPTTAVTDNAAQAVEATAEKAQDSLTETQAAVKQAAADQAEQITDKVKAKVEQTVEKAEQKVEQAVQQGEDG